MAGDWIKAEVNLPDKPEVYTIAAKLGIDPDAVVGKLLRVWAWANANCNADGVTSVTVLPLLNRCAGVAGFAEAMTCVHWLAIDSEHITFPNFDRHCSQTAKERANSNRRVAKHRGSCNAQTVTNVTPEPLQKPLPEKRREEYINTPPTPKGDGELLGIGEPTASEIYEAYPRHIARKEALKAIERIVRAGINPSVLLAKAQAYSNAVRNCPEDRKQFIPHPATWFNRGSYDDDPSEWVRVIGGASSNTQPIRQPVRIAT